MTRKKDERGAAVVQWIGGRYITVTKRKPTPAAGVPICEADPTRALECRCAKHDRDATLTDVKPIKEESP